ncbi:MAG: hypothetical protein AB7S74_12295 [Hyphomicrobium sp.]
MLKKFGHGPSMLFTMAWFFAAAILTDPARAQQGPVDFAKGELVASEACSFCHDVTVDESDPPDNKVPSFVAIANKPHQTAERLAETVLFPHRDMPQFSFDKPTDLRDVIAYIMTMRKKD